MGGFEHISEPIARVIYSCSQEIISQAEKAAALKRAQANTRAAFRHEWTMKQRAQAVRPHAIKGDLHSLALFISLADQYDEAVKARRACERIEGNYK